MVKFGSLNEKYCFALHKQRISRKICIPLNKSIPHAVIRGVDVNKRTVTTYIFNLLQGIRFGHYMSSCLFLSLLLTTFWLKLRYAFKFSRYVSLVNN